MMINEEDLTGKAEELANELFRFVGNSANQEDMNGRIFMSYKFGLIIIANRIYNEMNAENKSFKAALKEVMNDISKETERCLEKIRKSEIIPTYHSHEEA